MTLPEGVEPSEPTPAAEPVDSALPEATEPVTVAEEPVASEDASDAELRAWAKENGIEGVPTSGKLSAAWREQITAAMAAALDPKDEASADSSTSVETTTEETTGSGESASAPTEPVQPEFDNPYGEYRSVFKAPETFVHSQTYTS
jgi:hypothetical protein